MKKVMERFLTNNKIDFLKDSYIREFLTIHVGGKVAFIVFTDNNSELKKLLTFVFHLKQSFILIGGGSNIVFPDSAEDLTVIINRSSGISFADNNILKVNSGLKNLDFLEYCKKNSITEFEFLAGIPGSIGGATAVNAGAFGRSISDYITGGDIFTKGGRFEYKDKDYFEFEYRNSKFKYGKDIVLNIYLKYKSGDSRTIRDEIRNILKLRNEKHPPRSAYTAGCFFKNPVIDGKKISAGKLIEECNLKGLEGDNVLISDKHSNFIVNKGAACFSDIENIGRKIQKTVKDKNGITLEREVIFVSPEGEKY